MNSKKVLSVSVEVFVDLEILQMKKSGNWFCGTNQSTTRRLSFNKEGSHFISVQKGRSGYLTGTHKPRWSHTAQEIPPPTSSAKYDVIDLRKHSKK